MKWYLAKIVFRIVNGAGNHQPQFDEQWRLIAATDQREGFFKARTLGQQEKTRFLNQRQQWVQWQFIDVAELTDFEWKDGTLISDTITETDQADSYMRLVRDKAARICSIMPFGT